MAVSLGPEETLRQQFLYDSLLRVFVNGIDIIFEKACYVVGVHVWRCSLCLAACFVVVGFLVGSISGLLPTVFGAMSWFGAVETSVCLHQPSFFFA